MTAAPDADATAMSGAAPKPAPVLPSALRRAAPRDPLAEPPIEDLQDSDGFRDIPAAPASRPVGADLAPGQAGARRALGGG